MAVFRKMKNKENPYVMIDRRLLNDTNLSWKAKGILAYLLSLPDDWKIYENELVKHSRDGKESLRSGIKELINAGYIERVQLRDEKGRMNGYEYRVYETPTVIGKPENGDIDIGKQDTTNNNITNNDLTNIKPINIRELGNISCEKIDCNKTHLDTSDEQIEKESTELLEKMPNKLGYVNFIHVYRDVRILHSYEELNRVVDRYKESLDLLCQDFALSCCNFFRSGAYKQFLDENWIKTKDYIDEQIKRRKNAGKVLEIDCNVETLVEDDWASDLDDIFKY